MANINRQITLTSKGTNSGPLYNAFYSLDCINYTLCIDGSNLFLPNIGSTAIITVPDNIECLKLVNQTIGCGSNSEIQIINPTTTTTTSTTTTTCAPCCTGSITSITDAGGGNINIAFQTGSCGGCTATTIQTSSDNITWGGNNTAGCTSPRTIAAPISSTYYRIIIICSTGCESAPSNGVLYVPGSTTTTTTTAAPTTTTTTLPSGIYEFTGCGYGSSVAAACNDAGINNRTLYSDCNTGTFGVGCFVYVDTFPNALTGYTNVFMNGANWDVNSSTGQVTAYSSEQC